MVMKFSRLKASKNEGAGHSTSIDCPECGNYVHVTIRGSWGGSKVSDAYCQNCDSSIKIGGVVDDS